MNNELKLKQKRLFGSTEVVVNGITELKYINRSLLKTQEIPFSLDLLDPKPYLIRNISARSLFVVAVFAIMAAMFLYGYFVADATSKPIFIVFFFIVVGLTLMSIGSAIKSSAHYLIYTNRHNGANLFGISPKKPSREQVEKFAAELGKRINAIRYPENIPFEQKKEIYRQHIQFLLEQEVISEEEARTILERLSKRSGEKASVFKIIQ